MNSNFEVHKILFPTDFSKTSETAARYVAGFARANHAEVHLLHAVPMLSMWHGVSESYYNNLTPEGAGAMHLLQHESEKAATLAIEAFKELYFAGVPTHTKVIAGGVSACIIEYADEIQANLIMMTTQGQGPVRRFLIGSATAKVLHDSRRPLWTTPHIAEVGEYHPYRHIVCATDYRVLSRDLVVRAAAVARLFNGHLTVASAIPTPASAHPEAAGREHESTQAIKRQTTAVLEKNLKELNIVAAIDVVDGSVGEAVHRAAVFANADLIVIGHGQLGEEMGHLRTHAYEIIWNAPCPVLVI